MVEPDTRPAMLSEEERLKARLAQVREAFEASERLRQSETSELRARVRELENLNDKQSDALRRHLKRIRELEARVSEAQKAGTPYAQDRDERNALVLRVRELEEAIHFCPYCGTEHSPEEARDA